MGCREASSSLVARSKKHHDEGCGAFLFLPKGKGGQRRWRCTGQRGYSLSQKRIPPFYPPEKGLHCRLLARRVARAAQWRCGVHGFAMSLLRVVTDSNRALLRGARVTVARRRTAVRAAALLRSPLGSSGGNEKRPRQRSFYRLSVRPRR